MRPANLGIIKTFGKVVGDEHIAFRHEMTWYGEGYKRPAEDVLSDRQYMGEGDRYLMHEVRATIDPAVVRELGEQAMRTETA